MLRLIREPARAMYSWEFEDLLRKYKHPRHASIGVECNRFGAAPRKEFGLPEMGSIWVAPAGIYYHSRNGQWLADSQTDREWPLAISRNCIPYQTRRDAVWDEEKLRWIDGELIMGWKPAIESLIDGRHLRPDPYLSYLTGRLW